MRLLSVATCGSRPYFAELPHYLWGPANYDSEGDCKKPTDRNWSELLLENRVSREAIELCLENGNWTIKSDGAVAPRIVRFLESRATIEKLGTPPESDSQHRRGMKWANAVAKEFGKPELAPFDSHDFWGSWKWIGWYGTQFTQMGRLIMHSVVRNDPRAVELCIQWIKAGTYSANQSAALRYALARLTGDRFQTNREWIKWYEGSWFSKGARVRYPAPNFDSWIEGIKQELDALTNSA